MSCLLKLFRKKPRPPPPPTIPIRNPVHSERFSVTLSLEGPLPERDFELGLLENHLKKRMADTKLQSFRAYMNANACYQNGDMRKCTAFMTERRYHSEKLRQIGKRLLEVEVKRLELQSPPYLQLPPAVKFEAKRSYSMAQGHDVTNYSPPQMVDTRSFGRPRTSDAYPIPSAPPHLRGRS